LAAPAFIQNSPHNRSTKIRFSPAHSSPPTNGTRSPKFAGLKLVAVYREQFGADFISAMPTNLYGPGDNFDPETSHALPGMICKFHYPKRSGTKSVTLWGT
jgi:GDP-L-fucose synthase